MDLVLLSAAEIPDTVQRDSEKTPEQTPGLRT